MEIINKFKKSEKGSITMMVLTVMLFMLIVVTVSYFGISNKSIGQNKKISHISEQYQVTDEDMEQEYQKIANSLKVKDYVKVGDYVDYEPTIATKDGEMVDESKLTYTSPTGTIPTESTGIITHGNGYTSAEEGGGQTFTAKANDGSETGLKWRVLSVSDDAIELISDKVVMTDTGNNFMLQGGIGYLYGEQELNEICKIYGHGYGADTSLITEYTVGGSEDTVTGIIEGSGARSITVEDLNKVANITESDFKTLDASYGSEITYESPIYYPTAKSINTTNAGQSTSTKTKFKYTYYKWLKSKIEDTSIQDMLFNESYYLANRCTYPYPTYCYFSMHIVYAPGGGVGHASLCGGNKSNLNQYSYDFAVRPVVTIRSDVIDLSINYKEDNMWHLK